MDRFAKGFVIASFIYLLIGSLLGVAMVSHGGRWKGIEYYLIPTHTHVNLLGWMSMMIYGVSYHILPRFSGRPLYSRKLAWLHFYLAQAGLVGMASFFFLNRLQEGEWETALMVSGITMFISILIYLFNMLKTLCPINNLPERS